MYDLFLHHSGIDETYLRVNKLFNRNKIINLVEVQWIRAKKWHFVSGLDLLCSVLERFSTSLYWNILYLPENDEASIE